jgi:hypothetical protein
VRDGRVVVAGFGPEALAGHEHLDAVRFLARSSGGRSRGAQPQPLALRIARA